MTTKEIKVPAGADISLPEFGSRIARFRVHAGLTQAQLADQVGVGKRTVERLESGGSIQSASLLRILGVLGLQEGLLALFPDDKPRPMDLLKLKGKERQRASTKKRAAQKPDAEWTWGDGS